MGTIQDKLLMYFCSLILTLYCGNYSNKTHSLIKPVLKYNEEILYGCYWKKNQQMRLTVENSYRWWHVDNARLTIIVLIGNKNLVRDTGLKNRIPTLKALLWFDDLVKMETPDEDYRTGKTGKACTKQGVSSGWNRDVEDINNYVPITHHDFRKKTIKSSRNNHGQTWNYQSICRPRHSWEKAYRMQPSISLYKSEKMKLHNQHLKSENLRHVYKTCLCWLCSS